MIKEDRMPLYICISEYSSFKIEFRKTEYCLWISMQFKTLKYKVFTIH